VPAAINVRKGSSDVVEKLTVVHIELSGLDANAADGTEKRYYIKATASGEDALRSHVFAPNGGKHVWDNLLFPANGSWTVAVHDVDGDGVVASQAVTVDQA
jgi:hypothetical protein